MSVPDIVHSTLDGEEIAARVSLGGDDELFVTPTKTLLYRSDGLLSDESVESYPHDADRVAVSQGRRKSRIALEYSLDGSREITVPSGATDDVLHPVVAGVLSGNEITEAGESVVRLYRFSELTVIVTSGRLLKHVGEAVWDADYEEYRYEDVTGLSFEPGSVATQIVIEVDGHPQRIKAPNEEADDLRERLKRSLFEYHDVDSLDELNETLGTDEGTDRPEDPAAAFGSGVTPLDADPPAPDGHEDDPPADDEADATAPSAASAESGSSAAGAGGSVTDDAGDEGRRAHSAASGQSVAGSVDGDASSSGADDFEASGFEPASETAGETAARTASQPESTDDGGTAIEARLESLEATVERQTELIERQQATIEQLIEELRQGR